MLQIESGHNQYFRTGERSMTSNIFREHSIVIRCRTFWELTDLTGYVFREQWRAICFYFFVLALGAHVLNLTVFWSCFGLDSLVPSSGDASLQPLSFYYLLFCFVTLVELRFVETLLIAWLGIWFFHPGRKITFREVFSIWFNAMPQLLYYLVLFYPFYLSYSFIPQIILLERTPFFRRGTLLTTSRRAAYFHRAPGAEARQLGLCVMILFPFFLLVGYLFFFFWGRMIVFSSPLWPFIFHCVLFPLYLWGLLLIVCLFSFFLYLNIRIMREGWDLDIAFKAEMLRHQDRFPQEAIVPVSFDLRESFDPDDSEPVRPSAVSSFTISPGDDMNEINEEAHDETSDEITEGAVS